MFKKILITTLLISLSIYSYTQNFLGISVGHFYKGFYQSDYISLIGLRYEKKQVLKNHKEVIIWMEENYEYVADRDIKSSVDFFRTGLGFDLNFGKKFYYIIGGGLTYKIINTDNNFYKGFVKNNNNIFGYRINTGIGHILSDKISISIIGIINRDITPSYYELSPCQFFNNCGYDAVKLGNLLMQLSVSFKLFNKN